MEIFNFNQADVKAIKMTGTDTNAICKFLEVMKMFFEAKGFSHFTHPFEEGSEEFLGDTENSRAFSENRGKISNFFCSVLHEKFEKLYKKDIWRGDFKKVLRAISDKINPTEKRMFHLIDVFNFIHLFEKNELKEGFVEEFFSELNLAITCVTKDVQEMSEAEREETFKKACLKYTDKRKNTNKFVDIANWSEEKLQNYLDVEYERLDTDKNRRGEELNDLEKINVATTVDKEKKEGDVKDSSTVTTEEEKVDRKWVTEKINSMLATKSKNADDTQSQKVFGGKKRSYDNRYPHPHYKFNRAYSGKSRFNTNFNPNIECFACGARGHIASQCDMLNNGTFLAQRLQARGAVANNSEFGLPVSSRIREISNFNNNTHYSYPLLLFIYLLFIYLIDGCWEDLIEGVEIKTKIQLEILGAIDDYDTWITEPEKPIKKWLSIHQDDIFTNVNWRRVFELLYMNFHNVSDLINTVEMVSTVYTRSTVGTGILDTGATSHMTNELWKFKNLRECRVLVKTANAMDSMIVKERGDVGLLKDVLVTEKASSTLISASKLEEEGLFIVIKNGVADIMDVNNKSIICRAVMINGLYVFDKQELEKLILDDAEAICVSVVSEDTGETDTNDLLEFHRVMGHIDINRLRRGVSNDDYLFEDKSLKKRILDSKVLPCKVCMAAKPRCGVIPRQPVSHHGPLVKIGLDFKGYFPPSLCEGFTCCYIFIDYFTDFTFVYLAKNGDSAAEAIQACATKVISLGFRIQFLQTDAAPMFQSFKCKAVMNNLLIQHQTSSPYTQWQNGKIERHMGTVFGYSRSLLMDSGAPISCWSYALLHSTFLLNHSPKSDGSSGPMLFLKNQVLAVDNIPLFYQKGYRKIPEEFITNSLQSRTVKTRFMGYFNDFHGTVVCIDEETNRKMIVGINRTNFLKKPYIMNDIMPSLPRGFDSRVNYERHNDGSGLQATLENEIINIMSAASVGKEIKTAESVDESPDLPKKLPKTITEALSGDEADKWFPALENERENFIKYNTFAPCTEEELANLNYKDVIGTLMVFSRSLDNMGGLKMKARLVGRGDQQTEIFKDELFAGTTPAEVNKLLLNLCVAKKMSMKIFDVSAAFLEGRNDRLQYARIPKFFADKIYGVKDCGINIVKVIGNFYGFRQAPKIWADLFKEILIDFGFVRSLWVDTLYIYDGVEGILIISTHVDDALMVFNNELIVEKLREYLSSKVKGVKYNDDFSKFLGIEITRFEDGIKLHHSEYISNRFSCKLPQLLPILNQDMLKRDTEEKSKRGEELLKRAGALRFIVDRGRPDLLSHVNELSCGGYPESDELFNKIEGFLYGSKLDGIIFKSECEIKLICFCDASLIKTGDSKSRIGGSYFLNFFSGAFHNFSTKVSRHFSLISSSSCEVELKAIYETCTRGIYFMRILKELGCIKRSEPLFLFTDNQPAMKILMKGSGNHEIRLINNRIRRLQEWINSGEVVLRYVPSYLNVADMLTKCNLSRSRYSLLREILLSGIYKQKALFKLVEDALGDIY